MRKLSMEPPDRVASLQTLWENNKPAEPGPCGKNIPVMITITNFRIIYAHRLSPAVPSLSLSLSPGGFSQMYRCVCDWLGLPYKEEVQWVSIDTSWSIGALMLQKKNLHMVTFCLTTRMWTPST